VHLHAMLVAVGWNGVNAEPGVGCILRHDTEIADKTRASITAGRTIRTSIYRSITTFGEVQ
jgi:hypothetical protein